MRRLLTSLTSLSLLWANLVQAQEPNTTQPAVTPPSLFTASKADTFTPVDLDLEGDTQTTREEILQQFPALLEKELTPSGARALLRELYATGKYRDVAVYGRRGPAGDVLILVLKARLYITALSFTGLDESNLTKIERAFAIKKGDEFIEDRAARQGELVKLALSEMGYRSNNVTVFEGKKEGGVAVVVSVDLNEPTRIERVYLDGAAEMQAEAVKLLALRPGQTLDRTQTKEDTRTLKAFIRGLGYYDAQLSAPQEEERDGKLSLRYQVKLGPRYEVEFSGLSALTQDAARLTLRLEEEGIIASSTLGAASVRLREALQEKGFANAMVSASIVAKVDDFRLIRVEVKQGQKIKLAPIRFVGATTFTEKELQALARTRLVAGITPEEDPPTFALDSLGNISGRKSPYQETPEVQRPLRPFEIYRQKAISQTISEVKKRYLGLGYEAVKIGPEKLQWSTDGTEINIEIPIQEGPQTKVSTLTFTGNKALSRAELLAVSPLQESGPYTEEQREQLRAKTVELYTTKCYLYAKVTERAVRDQSKEAPRVSVELQIEEGPQVLFAGAKIEGNKEIKAEAIGHYVRLEKGEPLTPDKMREIQRRLLSLGIFESVSIEPERKDLPAPQKVIIVSVRERPARVTEASAGFSSDDGPRGQFLFTHGDVFGRMLSFSFRAKLNDSQFIAARDLELDPENPDSPVATFFKKELERKLVASLRNPLLGEAFGALVSAEVFVLDQRVNRAAFGVTKNVLGLSISTAAEQKRGFSFLLQADLEDNNAEAASGQDLDAIRASLPQAEQDLLDVFEGRTVLASLRPQLSYDLRNNPFNPTRGLFFQLNMEASRSINPTGSKLNFVSLGRVQTTAAAYVPYQRVVFEWVFRGGMVLPFSPESRTPPDRLFFVGGTSSVRGFPEEGLLPQDFADSLQQAIAVRSQESHGLPNSDFLTPVEVPRSLGANSFVSLSSTVRFPLPNAPNIEGSLFVDVGNGWLAPVSFDPFVLRASVGAGVRIPTAIGPIRFEAALKLDPRIDLEENILQFHFAVGSF
jgi:outer membrane protein insertion porin family